MSASSSSVPFRHPSGAQGLFSPRYLTATLGKKRLRRVTTALGRCFPFERDAALAATAAKKDMTPAQVEKEWAYVMRMGAAVKEFSIARLNGRREPAFAMLAAEDIKPKLELAAGAVDRLLGRYELVTTQSVVASSALNAADVFDAVFRDPATQQLVCCDFHYTTRPPTDFAFGVFDTRCPFPLKHLANTPETKRGLAAALKGFVARHEGYPSMWGGAGEAVDQAVAPQRLVLASVGIHPDGFDGDTVGFTTWRPDDYVPHDATHTAALSADAFWQRLLLRL